MSETAACVPVGEALREQFLAGFPVAVDPQAIERELVALWQPPDAEAPGELSAGVTRVCLANWIVCTSLARAADVATVVHAVTTTFPCRVLFIGCGTTNDPAPSVRASVTAACQLPEPGAPQVCCEIIRVEYCGAGCQSAARDIPGVVLPLLEPDIPACLWWAKEADAENPLFHAVAGIADVVLADSRDSPDPPAFWQSLRTLAGQRAVHDLAWGMTRPWRRVLAEWADDPEVLAVLRQAHDVTITFAADTTHPAPHTPAALLGGWLAVQLGWAETTRVQLTSEVVAGATGGTLIRCEVAAPDATPPTTLRFEPARNGARVQLTTTIPGTCPLPQHRVLDPPSLAGAIRAALELPRTDTRWLRAAAAANARRSTPASL